MFFIVWGFRSYARTLAVLTLACRNGHTSAHRLVRITRKFTLFWIPLFPVSKRYYSVCSLCGIQVAWSREDAEAAAASAARVAGANGGADPVSPPVNPALPPEQQGFQAFPAASPTTPPPTSNQYPAGWYPDGQPGRLRYWDGKVWTEHTQPVGPSAPQS